MTAFTNRYTAVAKTLQVDSGQAARDLALMLRAGTGGAGMDVRTFVQMLPFMRQVAGQADLTRESFNKMNEQARAKLLEETFKKLQPMLDKSASSFDAMKGAMTSNVEEIIRAGSAPLFEGMKSGLNKVNNLLFDANGKIQPLAQGFVNIGKSISENIVSAFSSAWDAGSKLFTLFEDFQKSDTFNSIS